jgi:hypothetical protein
MSNSEDGIDYILVNLLGGKVTDVNDGSSDVINPQRTRKKKITQISCPFSDRYRSHLPVMRVNLSEGMHEQIPEFRI